MRIPVRQIESTVALCRLWISDMRQKEAMLLPQALNLGTANSAQLSWTRFPCLRTRSHMHALEFYLQIPEHHSYVPWARPPATIKNASAACWLSRALLNTASYYEEYFANGCKGGSDFSPMSCWAHHFPHSVPTLIKESKPWHLKRSTNCFHFPDEKE